MVNFIPRFNFNLVKLQCCQGFLRQKINVQMVLVLNLVEKSKEFLVFILQECRINYQDFGK